MIASLVLGTLHALWHLPLWSTGDPYNQLSLHPAFVIQVIAVAVLYTWPYNGTRRTCCWPSFSHRTQRTADFDLASPGLRQFHPALLAPPWIVGRFSDHRGGRVWTVAALPPRSPTGASADHQGTSR